MRARVHSPFTHTQYMNTLSSFNVSAPLPQSRAVNPVLSLMYVLDEMNTHKSNGGNAAAAGNLYNGYFNRGRNFFE